MQYIYSNSNPAIVYIRGTLVAAGINVAILVAVNGLGAIFNTAFLSVSPLFESVCTRFC